MTNHRTRTSLVALLAASILAVPTTSLGAAVRVRATTSNTWNPYRQFSTRGQAVVWVNPTGVAHTVTAYGGNWSKHTRIEPGERTRRVFQRTGRFKYRCRLHSHLAGTECHGMCGVIRVR